MVIMVIILMGIGGYYINDYCEYYINGYYGHYINGFDVYSISGYWCLLTVIILMVLMYILLVDIGGY
jgi:hypothetical protein